MKWKQPPIAKIYEALSCVADGRIQLEAGQNEAKVTSTSGGKVYFVRYEPDANAIAANDNGSFWQGYLGYPSIAYLLQSGRVQYDKAVAAWLKNVPWKDINTAHKNDFKAAIEQVRTDLKARGHDLKKLDGQIEHIATQIEHLQLNKLGGLPRPPAGY